jgi:hypothetical protein
MNPTNPYRRWRRTVYVAGAVTIVLLTALVLLSLLGCLLGWAGVHLDSGHPGR